MKLNMTPDINTDPAGPPSHCSCTAPSRRDWFAAHAPNPGQAEILSVAAIDGVRVRKEWPVDASATALPTWAEWWNTLTNAQRYRYYAKCNLAYADAMMAELAAPDAAGQE